MYLLGVSFGYIEIAVVLITLSYVIYKYSTRNFDYWKKRGVPYVKPLPLIGNFLDVFTFRRTIGHHLAKYYNDFETPYFGMFVMNTPHLIVKDPNIIKSILVKDFNYFQDRNLISDEKCDGVSAKMLFMVKNPEWKLLRTKMTPVFTTGKIKSMLNLINGAADEMVTYINKNLDKNSLEAKELCAKYSTNVIASCAFGIDAHSFENENAEFRAVGRKMFDSHWKTAFRQTSYFVAPSLVKLLRLPFLDPSVSRFVREVFWATIANREKTNVKRNDLIDIIIKMKCQDAFGENYKFEGDKVVAQAAQFYAAGFETVSATMSFTFYELCLQPKIQNRLRSEIKSVLSRCGELTYEALQDMKYLHMVICETLRKYPVLPFLDRLCLEDYTIPGTNFVIEKGTPVFIPMFGLHYDTKYFADPETYDPERFNDENKSKLPSYAYLPFGDGPRNCIGERFGLLVTKLGVAKLIAKYDIEKSENTPIPINWDPKTFLLSARNGLPMKFKKTVSDAA
ncbi:hypothetical protein ILUMI_19912 [Ignelater luminosus]|uniref:Cytochrome P450 n=1 Tax=Ignelater luminosus TaxID=2038154 RepID=A0A8K0G549_IGNLU|nr:hypothetical protein ILUMI_19912 [Ignelater luminosus]